MHRQSAALVDSAFELRTAYHMACCLCRSQLTRLRSSDHPRSIHPPRDIQGICRIDTHRNRDAGDMLRVNVSIWVSPLADHWYVFGLQWVLDDQAKLIYVSHRLDKILFC